MCEEYLEAASLEERDHLVVLFAEILRMALKERSCKTVMNLRGDSG